MLCNILHSSDWNTLTCNSCFHFFCNISCKSYNVQNGEVNFEACRCNHFVYGLKRITLLLVNITLIGPLAYQSIVLLVITTLNHETFGLQSLFSFRKCICEESTYLYKRSIMRSYATQFKQNLTISINMRRITCVRYTCSTYRLTPDHTYINQYVSLWFILSLCSP